MEAAFMAASFFCGGCFVTSFLAMTIGAILKLGGYQWMSRH